MNLTISTDHNPELGNSDNNVILVQDEAIEQPTRPKELIIPNVEEYEFAKGSDYEDLKEAILALYLDVKIRSNEDVRRFHNCLDGRVCRWFGR